MIPLQNLFFPSSSYISLIHLFLLICMSIAPAGETSAEAPKSGVEIQRPEKSLTKDGTKPDVGDAAVGGSLTVTISGARYGELVPCECRSNMLGGHPSSRDHDRVPCVRGTLDNEGGPHFGE